LPAALAVAVEPIICAVVRASSLVRPMAPPLVLDQTSAAPFQWRARSAQCGCGRSRPCQRRTGTSTNSSAIFMGSPQGRAVATGPAMTAIRVQINGAPVADDVPRDCHWADFLRDRRQSDRHTSRLRARRVRCLHGPRPTGEPARSCLMVAVACDEREITTIEGFSGDRGNGRAAAEFSSCIHALQCGLLHAGNADHRARLDPAAMRGVGVVKSVEGLGRPISCRVHHGYNQLRH